MGRKKKHYGNKLLPNTLCLTQVECNDYGLKAQMVLHFEGHRYVSTKDFYLLMFLTNIPL